MTTTVKAADLKPGTAVIWLGERHVVEAVRPDPQDPGTVDIHIFGITRWFATPADAEVEVTR